MGRLDDDATGPGFENGIELVRLCLLAEGDEATLATCGANRILGIYIREIDQCDIGIDTAATR